MLRVLMLFTLVLCLHVPGIQAAPPPPQETIQLYNGDRLTGEVIRMEDEILTLRASYAPVQDIQIRWKDVSCITSDRDLTFVLTDYETIEGRAVCPSPGTIQIASAKFGLTGAFALTELRAINPSIYSGILNFGGNYASGNTNTAAANLSTTFQVRTRRHRFTVQGIFNYGESDGTTTARNSTGSIKYDNFMTEKLYTYAQSLAERDSFQNLNLRSTQGLGLGWQFFDRRNRNLFVEAGISYLNEDYITGDDRQNASGRWSVGLNYDIIPERLKLFHLQEGYYTPGPSTWYFRTQQGFRMPLIGNYSVNFEVDWKFNSRPDPGKQKSDVYVILGLTYQYAYW